MSTGDHHYLLHGLDPDLIGYERELPGIWNQPLDGVVWREALDSWGAGHVH